jgi:hypothetical protein
MQCKIKFVGEADRFTHETQKVLFAASYLGGVAFEWITPYLVKAEENPENPPACIQTFQAF